MSKTHDLRIAQLESEIRILRQNIIDFIISNSDTTIPLFLLIMILYLAIKVPVISLLSIGIIIAIIRVFRDWKMNSFYLAETGFVYNNDFYDHSVSGFDFVFVYPDEPMHRRLEKKLLNELTGKLLHYGYHFHPQDLRAENKFLVNGNLFTIYSNSGKS